MKKSLLVGALLMVPSGKALANEPASEIVAAAHKRTFEAVRYDP